VLRLDYLSCLLTIASTVLVGRRCWEGWALATVNSVIICIIGFRTAQLGFIPANIFCIAMSAINLRSWRRKDQLVIAASARDGVADHGQIDVLPARHRPVPR
jgi:hypothetical protein